MDIPGNTAQPPAHPSAAAAVASSAGAKLGGLGIGTGALAWALWQIFAAVASNGAAISANGNAIDDVSKRVAAIEEHARELQSRQDALRIAGAAFENRLHDVEQASAKHSEEMARIAEREKAGRAEYAEAYRKARAQHDRAERILDRLDQALDRMAEPRPRDDRK